MAAKRTKVTTVREELPEKEAELEGPDIVEGTDDLGILLAGLEPSGIRVEVFIESTPGKMEWCDTLSGVTEIDKGSLREQFGGGKYELRVFDGPMHIRTVIFRIANKKVAPTNGNGNGDSSMREQYQFMKDMTLALLRRPSDGISVKDLLPLLINRGEGLSGDGVVTLITKGMDLGSKASSGNGDWKSELVGAIKEALPAVGQILSMKSNPPQQHQQLPTEAQSTDNILRTIIAEMKQQVLGGLPVDLAINWVLANAQKPEYTQIIHAVLRAPYDDFAKLDSQLNEEPFKTWFSTLHNAIHEAYKDANENNPDENT